jgi:hypothetical protein
MSFERYGYNYKFNEDLFISDLLNIDESDILYSASFGSKFSFRRRIDKHLFIVSKKNLPVVLVSNGFERQLKKLEGIDHVVFPQAFKSFEYFFSKENVVSYRNQNGIAIWVYDNSVCFIIR